MVQPDDVIAERFIMEAPAGKGASGTVYRARDRDSGRPVAVKLLHVGSSAWGERFAREARVLAGLDHPAIVRHIAHGQTAAGELWLAMEWLDGMDLGKKLAGGRLSILEAMTVARIIAGALGFAHAQGIVHRDVKPSNIFLPNGDIARAKLLDFGIARPRAAVTQMTRTGMMVGTPGYIAPEQARARQVDARADVFSLGCVLYECLVGQPAFMGEDALASLAKLVLEEAPRPSEHRPELPAALDDVVARMLAKEPENRPRDGAQVVRELGAVRLEGTSVARAETRPLSDEQHLLCIVLAEVVDPDPTLIIPPTSPSDLAGGHATLASAVASYGGHLEPLADGSLVVTLSRSGGATDLAAQAARCALAVREEAPHVPIAVATGRGVVRGRLPVGEVIDRAARLLRTAAAPSHTSLATVPGVPAAFATSGAQDHAPPIRVDNVTAGLLDARFQVVSSGSHLELLGERSDIVASRRLLGKPTTCVGRERELGMLHGVLDECLAEPCSRPVLVTAEAGVGKSRLRYEFVNGVRARGGVEIWIARGDPLSAGSPFGLLSQVIGRAVGIVEGAPPEVRQGRLSAHIGEYLPAADAPRVTEFLAELLGVPFSSGESIQLRAARRDARLMGDQMRRAFEEWLSAECAAHPVLLILEDLHWGDVPTVSFVDHALRVLEDQPLLVLALARPDIDTTFPELWHDHDPVRIPLGELSRRAARKLVREVLGADTPDETVATVIERAAGNAFYLEELIRAVAEGKGDALPGTVLAMVNARLAGLPAEARRILRAASVFGRVFWRGGVTTLLGGEQDGSIDGWLAELTASELISRRLESRFPAEEELVFRHALLREGAYATLTESDRARAHRRAAAWLEATGEAEPLVLAEHFERGGQPKRAVALYFRAATQALEGNDLSGAIASVDRGVVCGAQGEVLAELRVIEAEARTWRAEYAAATTAASEAMALAKRGSELWCRAAKGAQSGRMFVGDVEGAEPIIHDLLSLEVDGPVSEPLFTAWSWAASMLYLAGRRDLADPLADRVEAAAIDRDDPAFRALYLSMSAFRALLDGDIGASVQARESCITAHAEAGDERGACLEKSNVADGYVTLGQYERAEATSREVLATARRMGLSIVITHALHVLGRALGFLGRLDEAREAEAEAAARYAAGGERRMEAGCRVCLADILAAVGDSAGAAREARAAVAVSDGSPITQIQARAVLARTLLAEDLAGALEQAEEAMRLLEETGNPEEGDALVRLVWTEALMAAERGDEAKEALSKARERLLHRASLIRDESLRASFLERVPENARTLALAEEWGLPPA